jgi:membrane dipeptidase
VIAVFDGHNDTLTREDADDFVAGRAGGHLDLPRARAGGLAGGIFALFTPSPKEEEAFHTGPDGRREVPPAEPIGQDVAAAHATRAAGRLVALARAGHVRLVLGPGDLDAARADGVLAAVMHLEGAEAIDPGLEALDLWHAAGLRSLGPVWSRSNAFGHGVPFAFPASPDTGPGLTAAGKALVARCAELGIAVDLSHLNEAGFWDVARLDGAPLIASHSGAHALSAASRNLTDRQLDAIGSSGGLVGIVFAAPFLRGDGRNEPDTPLATLAAHARYVADRIGVEHVALGSDFDGATIPSEVGDVAGLPRLLDALSAVGFTDDELRAIAWDNWRRVLERAWGGGGARRGREPGGESRAPTGGRFQP